MTSVPGSAVADDTAVRVQLLHVADCPLVGKLRTMIQRALARSGLHAEIEELEGPFPSPTLLIDAVDATGRNAGSEPSCRLDLPSEEQILTALIRATHEQSARQVSSVDGASTSRARPDARHSHPRNVEKGLTPEAAT